jgi:hypothetical protein
LAIHRRLLEFPRREFVGEARVALEDIGIHLPPQTP